jgi:hypothetical protein
MTRATKTAAVAATMLSCLLTGATASVASATETINYRVAMAIAGSWSEAVRADLDPDDADRDGTENVAVRDSTLRFALSATMADVPLRGGRVVKPVYDVADASLTQDVAGSTYTDFYGTSGACAAQNQGATGGGTVASPAAAGAGIVFRPSSDAVLDLECHDPYAHWSMSVDLLRVAASNVVPELGQAPLDVAFGVPRRSVGAWRVVVPVTASAAQRAFERCPREDPGHTVACPFGWDGTVTLERLTPEVDGARLGRGGASVSVRVRCAAACAPVLRAGAGASKTYKVAPGAARRLTLPLGAAARRTLARTGRVRLVVAIGAARTTFSPAR